MSFLIPGPLVSQLQYRFFQREKYRTNLYIFVKFWKELSVMNAGCSQTVGKNKMAIKKKWPFTSEYGIWFYSMKCSTKL